MTCCTSFLLENTLIPEDVPPHLKQIALLMSDVCISLQATPAFKGWQVAFVAFETGRPLNERAIHVSTTCDVDVDDVTLIDTKRALADAQEMFRVAADAIQAIEDENVQPENVAGATCH